MREDIVLPTVDDPMTSKFHIHFEDLLRQRTVEGERIEYKAGWNHDAVIPTLCALAKPPPSMRARRHRPAGPRHATGGALACRCQPRCPPAQRALRQTTGRFAPCLACARLAVEPSVERRQINFDPSNRPMREREDLVEHPSKRGP